MLSWQWPWVALLLPLPWVLFKLFPKMFQSNTDNRMQIWLPRMTQIRKAFAKQVIFESHSQRWQHIVWWLIWLMIIVATMRPEIIRGTVGSRNHGYDLMLAMDLSPSMAALDFSKGRERITRLDVTKSVITTFVSQRKGDRVGLVVFGEEAYLYIPLTLDTESVSKMLQGLTIGMAGPSTSIGDAIAVSVQRLKSRPADSRVLILITDGEDTSSRVPPAEAIKLAVQFGVKIYTIGIGSNGLVPIEDEYGRIIQAHMPIDEILLKEIADKTGGIYSRATNENALKEIYNYIDQLEKTQDESKSKLIKESLHHWPASIAMILLCLLILPKLKNRQLEVEI